MFQFRDLVLHGVLVTWSHRLGIRLASHEPLKRDGGEQEPMGAAVGRFSYRCVFLGADATARYNNLVLSVRQNPRGILVDPRLGRIQAACEGIEASETPETGVDCIEFEARFAEDALDTALASAQPLGPSAYAAQVTAALGSLTDLVDARFLGNPVRSFLSVLQYAEALGRAAEAYADAALAALQTDSPNPALRQLLGVVLAQQDALLVALQATRAYTLEPDVSLTPYRAQARQVYSACLQLQDSITALKPPVILFPVTTAMSLVQVAVVLYGKDAQSKVPEIRALNRLETPYWIPAGTVLKVVAPQVRQ
ncbi:MAG: DNA circularization N-terminal domain-containing protein [Polyangia bacterium]